jgi:hypothetical protein
MYKTLEIPQPSRSQHEVSFQVSFSPPRLSHAELAQPEARLRWTRSHKQDASRTGFLDLPRELREIVYEYALCVEGAIFVYSSDPDYIRHTIKAKVVREKAEGPKEPQSISSAVSVVLLRTCRQLHAEGAAILYGKNLFRLYTTKVIFDPSYHSLISHITFITDADHRVYESDLETASYWWRRRFWPHIMEKSTQLLEMYPGLRTLTFPIQPNHIGVPWRPAFMASDTKTPEQRIALAAAWMTTNCPFDSDRVRECLHMELLPAGSEMSRPPHEEETIASRVARIRARVAQLTGNKLPGAEWDRSEFTQAFERMKLSSLKN